MDTRLGPEEDLLVQQGQEKAGHGQPAPPVAGVVFQGPAVMDGDQPSTFQYTS